MRELLLFSQSQTLINHWIHTVNDDYSIAMNRDDLYTAFDSNKRQILLYDMQSFSNLFEEVIKESKPFELAVFVLTGAPSFEKGSSLLPFKIAGYGNSYMSAGNLQLALEVISEGKVWLYPDFVQALILQAAQKSQENEMNYRARLNVLTPKEMEVSHLVAQGMSNKEVAIQLDITERTTKAHLTHIYEKLNISDRLSLALMFKSKS